MKRDLIDKYLINNEPLTEDIISVVDALLLMDDDDVEKLLSEAENEDTITKAYTRRTIRRFVAKKLGMSTVPFAALALAKRLYKKAKQDRTKCRFKCRNQHGQDKEDCISNCSKAVTKSMRARVAKVRDNRG